MSVLKQAYNLYKLFNGTLEQSLNEMDHIKLKENLRTYFDEVILIYILLLFFFYKEKSFQVYCYFMKST